MFLYHTLNIAKSCVKTPVDMFIQVKCVSVCCLRCSTLWCYGGALRYHSVTANKSARSHIPEPTSATSHMRHLHVTCRRYNLSTTFGCFSVTFWYHILNIAKIVKKRQFTYLYESSVFVYVAYVAAHYGVIVGPYGTTVSL